MKARAVDAPIKRLISRGSEQQKISAPVIAEIQQQTGSSIGNLTARIIGFLEANHGKSYRADDIFHGLGGGINMKTLRCTLSRLAKDKRIGKHGRGRYRAAGNSNTVDSMAAAA
jgi:hypothetical protein